MVFRNNQQEKPLLMYRSVQAKDQVSRKSHTGGQIEKLQNQAYFNYSAEIGQNLLSFGFMLVIPIFITKGRCNELKANFAAS